MKIKTIKSMKNTIIFGGLGLIISFMTTIALILQYDYFFFSFHFLFILPVGSLLLGYFIFYGIGFGIKKDNRLIYWIFKDIFIISLLFYIGIFLVSYRFAVVDYNGEIKYDLTGNHVSNYVDKSYGKMNIINYYKFLINNTTRERYIAINGLVVEEKSSDYGLRIFSVRSENIIFFIIDFLGLFIGGYICVYRAKNAEYCHNCKLYYKKKTLIRIRTKNFKSLYYHRILDCMYNENRIPLNNINHYKKNVFSKEPYVEIQSFYCPKCSNSIVYFKYFTKSLFKYELSKLEQFDGITLLFFD